MSMGFFSAFLQAGGKQTVRNLTTELVKRAPNTSIQAGQIVEESKLDDAGAIIQRTRHSVDEAQAHFDATNAQYGQLMGAAEVLQANLVKYQATIDDPAAAEADKDVARSKLAATNLSLMGTPDKPGLLDKIEKISPDLEHYRTELNETQQYLREATAAYNAKAGNLIKSGEEAEQAKRDLERARLAAEQAHQHEEDSRVLAGLASTGTGINPAIDAMKKATQAAKDEAAEATLKANALRAHVDHGEDDPIIQAALAEAAGTTSPQTVAERLAALKAKAA
jgi:hypothetical protein